jgi:DNA (cytosine-5)-methyltransferase 1
MHLSYNWNLKTAKFEKNKGKVFSCFACGGGSTMGYKLAGFDVVGFNEIDHRMAEMYIKNHQPKHAFVEPIQTLKEREDLPDDLYDLAILDGSPPCSSFSMSGTREKDWGKLKKFKEGQAVQVLDTLFYDFIDLAKKLQPKVVVAENVTGILKGNARDYVRRIFNEFEAAGYHVQEFELNASEMGVPQRRVRVFFIAIRKDLAVKLQGNSRLLFGEFPALNMQFARNPVPFSEIRHEGLNDMSWTDHDQYIWDRRVIGDKKYSDVLLRAQDRHSNFSGSFIYPDKVLPTLVSCEGSKMTLFDEPRRANSVEMIRAQSFPLDYDFMTDKASKIQYVLGMSVPPLMVAEIANRLYDEWREIF